jgi:hypothetical protein
VNHVCRCVYSFTKSGRAGGHRTVDSSIITLTAMSEMLIQCLGSCDQHQILLC